MHKKPSVVKNIKIKTTPFQTVKSNANKGSIYERRYSAVIVFSSFACLSISGIVLSFPLDLNSIRNIIQTKRK